ncbi:hypothetical protein, partial [Escherichia coli]
PFPPVYPLLYSQRWLLRSQKQKKSSLSFRYPIFFLLPESEKKHRITETILHAIFFLRRILKGYGQIFLRSLSERRNLLTTKRKNRLAGRFFEGSQSYQLFEPR